MVALYILVLAVAGSFLYATFLQVGEDIAELERIQQDTQGLLDEVGSHLAEVQNLLDSLNDGRLE